MPNTDKEHFYYVDPGIGEKSRGCPYTFYKDGRDVRRYIHPPRGYELTNFKFEPYDGDSFYDGKIVAQYKKMPLSKRVRKNPVAYLLSFLGIVGVLGVLAYYFINSQPTPVMPPKQQAKSEVKVAPNDTTAQEQVSDSSLIAEVVVNEESEQKEIVQEEVIEEKIEEKVIEPVKEEIVQEEVKPVEQAVEPKEKEIATKPEPKPDPVQAAQPTAELSKEQFRQEFWDLIHCQERNMRTYFALYNKYKNENLKSKEFYYLYLTILENSSAFNKWNANLVRVPADEIKTIRTISALTEKLEQYE